MAGPSEDGLSYLLDDLDNNFTLSPGFLNPYPNGLLALGGNDRITGSSAGEIINGNRGQDTIFGGGGSDILYGGKENDYIDGGDDNDFLSGNIGQDFIVGGRGDDTIRGGKDEDVLVGGEGNDTLIGDFGVDVLVGSVGSDLFGLRRDTATTDRYGADGILDFDKSSDRIGLIGGLTEADIILQPFNEPIQALLSKQGISDSPAQARLTVLVLTGVDIDPNGDGIASGTQITIASTGEFLGYALNATAADLSGRFVSLPPV